MPRLFRALLAALAVVVGCLASTGTQADPTLKIVVGRLSATQVARLEAAAPKAKIVSVASEEAALEEIGDADALIGILSEDLVKAGKNLKWIQVLSAGVDRYQYPSLIESEIVFTNAKVIQGPNVADQAMALLLAMTRQIVRASALAAGRDWRQVRRKLKEGSTIELAGKTALVIGYGGIGAAIAERAHGFGMEILATAHNTDKPHPEWVTIYPPEQLEVLLPRARVVFVAVPLTPETRGMINAKTLAAMADGTYLVNIARGPVVDTDAMVAALQSGKLAGAGLDVTDPEPLPPDHVLWTLDNVVLTPHMGGSSDVVWERRVDLARDNLAAFVQGKPLRNVVDKRAGY